MNHALAHLAKSKKNKEEIGKKNPINNIQRDI